MAARERRVIVVAGQRRSGKTTLTSILARQAIAAGAKGRTKIIDPSGELGGIFPDDLELFAKQIVTENMRAIKEGSPVPTSLLILDDADTYLPPIPTRKSAWWQIYMRSAQLDLDLLISCKRLQNLAPSLLNGADWVYCFRLPKADTSGRERLATIIDPSEIPSRKYHFVQVDPSGDEKHYGKTVILQDGTASIQYLSKEEVYALRNEPELDSKKATSDNK